MKTAEYCIGNFINYKGSQKQIIGLNINLNCELMIGFIPDEKGMIYFPTMDEHKYFEPITLTEEWLVKFGGRIIKSKHILYNLNGFAFVLEGNEWTYVVKDGSASYPFKYIHSLQNLYFALSGEELKRTTT